VTLIDRYVLTTFLRTLGWALLAFLSVFMLIDLVDHIDNFIDDGASGLAILKYYIYILPQYVDYVLPMSMLLASLFTVGMLSKNREYSAILSAGVSLARMSRTVLLMGLLVTIAAGAFREFVVAEANRRHAEVERYEIQGKQRDRLQGKANFVHVDEAGRVYVVSRFRPRPPILESVSVQTFSDSTLVARIDAQRALWREDHWELVRGTVRSFSDSTETVEPFEARRLEPPIEPPREFSKKSVDPEEMNWRELRVFSERVRRTGGDVTPYLAEMAHKVSFPLVNFLVVVLGLALGAARRKTTLWAGFGFTVSLAFGYYLLMSFGLELGRSGTVPALVSAWTGNALYATGGLVLFLRANR